MINILRALSLLFLISACNTTVDYGKLVPTEVDAFAKGFITNIQKGDIDKCLADVVEEIRNDGGRTFLTNVSGNIKSFQLDSLRMINARYSKLLGEEPLINYSLEYEQQLQDNFIYFFFTIREKDGELKIAAFDARGMETSLTTVHEFTFKGKSIKHYLFLIFSVLSVGFIILTLISAIRTPLKPKWPWIIGILFAFVKFKLDWTTGELGFQLLSFQLLGAGFSKSGLVAPWTLTFSIPIIAMAFWMRLYKQKRELANKEKLNPIIEKLKSNNGNEDEHADA